MLLHILNEYNVDANLIINGSPKTNILNNFPIYVINLKKDIYRRSYIKYLFKKWEINYTLVIVNKVTITDINKWQIQQRFRHLGQLGCVLSHMWCLNNAINSNYNKFIIFEDDIIFHKNFNDYIAKYLTYDLDLLMLGACDFELEDNIVNINIDNDLYFPKVNALGAHANIYSLNFAKTLFDHKIKNDTIIEFDKDYSIFYDSYKIGICYPNLVICELSTTNINHFFSPLKRQDHNYYIDKCFMGKINYNNYNCIILEAIKYIYENNILNKSKDYKEAIGFYIDKIRYNLNIKNIIEMLNSNDYTLDDLSEINSIIVKETEKLNIIK